MNNRRSRQYKMRRPMFAFGHVMLPVVGIIAIGLLVVGVKLFFLPPPSEEPPVVRLREPSPYPSVPPDVPGRSSDDADRMFPLEALENRNNNGDAVAAPRRDGQKPEKIPKAKGPFEKAPTASPGKGPTLRPREELPSTGAKWGIQIGAFTERFQADQLGAKARQQGYAVVVVQAKVKGKDYFRVRVVGGANRDSAEELRRKLQHQGYPTILVRL